MESKSAFPLDVQVLDHYTLIVEDAAAVARFHQEVLGFLPLRIQEVNAGSVPEGQYDMLNHVLQIPGTSRRVLVVTEGLTEDSIFRRYMRENGPGVHHLAYEVADLDSALLALREAGVRTTSEEIMRDPLTGLRQIFIDRSHSGYFVELIERTEAADGGTFTNQNMAALAKTMIQYLREEEPAVAGEQGAPAATIEKPFEEVCAYVSDPHKLGLWTGHRNIRELDGKLVEVRMIGDVPFSIEQRKPSPDACEVAFLWQLGESRLEVVLDLRAQENATRVSARLPELQDDQRLQGTRKIIQTELDILSALMEGRPESITAAQRELVDEFHLEVYQRQQL